MRASEFAGKYLHLTATLFGNAVKEVAIAKYLNNGIRGQNDEKPHPLDYRPNRADSAKDNLLSAVKNELKIKGHMPVSFDIEGSVFQTQALLRPFIGKGSPADIMDVFWLASRYKQITVGTVSDYADKYMGLDCNGFAGNFWGINPSTDIANFDVNRRTKIEDVQAGDAMIWYRAGTTSNPYHLSVIDQVLSPQTKDHPLQFDVTQSAGPEDGVHTKSYAWKLKQNAKGHVTMDMSNPFATNVYFAAGPQKNTPNGLDWKMKVTAPASSSS
jgi:hypothetical protein